MPDNIKMSGDFRGAIINIKSTLTNVQQSVGAMATEDPNARQELEELIGQLSENLQQVPENNREDAQAVADLTQSLVETAKAEQPNKTTLQITGEGLKKAAQNLAEVMPAVIPIVTQIVAAVAKIIAK
jgi:methyl-accepting chemotaxis protein